MSAENNKLLWIVVAVCVGVLGFAVAGLFLFAPRTPGGAAPATIGDTATPKVVEPQDYLNAPPPTPLSAQPRTEGDIIVIYGDKPETIPPAAAVAVGAAAGAESGAASPPPAATTTTTVAPKPAVAKPAASPTPPAAKPVAKTTTTTTARPAAPAPSYWIQVGSFSSRGRADELREVLGDKGIAAVIQVRDIDGKSWYRVRIGPWELKKEADGWLARVKAIPGCGESLVIQDRLK